MTGGGSIISLPSKPEDPRITVAKFNSNKCLRLDFKLQIYWKSYRSFISKKTNRWQTIPALDFHHQFYKILSEIEVYFISVGAHLSISP